MPHYIALTRLLPGSLGGGDQPPQQNLRELAHRISAAIRQHVPEARWLESYALLGRYGFLDVFELPGHEHAQRLEMTIRAAAGVDVEIIPVATVLHSPTGNLLQQSNGHQSAALPMAPDEVTESSVESFPASDAPAW